MKKQGYILFLLLWGLAACGKISKEITTLPQPEKKDVWLLEDMSNQKVTGNPGGGAATAEFKEEGSKTHSEMSDDGTYAKVIWNPGDSFEMLTYDSSTGKYPYTVYTTSDGGEVANFSYSSTLTIAPFYCIYPSIRKITRYNGSTAFGVTIPINQTATASSISPGSNVSFCRTNVQNSNFHFLNCSSFIKFRLSGSVVSSVTSISLKGGNTMAGDCILLVEEDGTPVLTNEIYFNDDVKSNTVTLTGSFRTGVDYYFTVMPGTQYGFTMSFSDGTNRKTLVSNKKIILNRSIISDLGTINIGSDLIDDDPENATLYIQSTSGKTPVSIAVISEGFKQEELSDFEMLAKSGIDMMFSVEPFKSYKEYFNVWILKTPSNQSGSSITDGSGNIIKRKDTYFESRWGSESYSDMTANLDKVLAFVTNNCPDVINGIHTGSEVATVMIINDTRYGGICHNYTNSRCLGMVPYVNAGGVIGWGYPDTEAVNESTMTGGTRTVTNAEKQALGISQGDWRNILLHEFGGHGFSRLLDEYWYSSYLPAVTAIDFHAFPVHYGLNISATYNNPPWQSALLDNLSTLEAMNPLYSRIGVYHGGQVSIFNRWRSERISCMIDNRRYFSTWQRLLIVKRILDIAGETFNLTTFFSKDDPTDPLRDIVTGATYGSVTEKIPPKVMPMLPAPVIHEE
ncbi:MAG: hypothetical protein J6T35_00995 [Bacteroidales bacterium]|nr:hypothetical protein [Bacteroidales bacterium]